ncbi:MAG: alpha/beta hydrolase [Myxococcota bacterium]
MQVESNGIRIEVETRGAEDAPAFVLIRGLSTQLIQWPDVFLDRFVAAGFRVVVFDNRDCGLSSKLDAAPMPDGADVLAGRVPAPYGVGDMARDVVGVLDALGIEQADVAGISLGGMIAQHLAFDHASRFRSVTSIMSSSGAPGLPSGTPEAMQALMERPADPDDREAVIEHNMRSQRVIGSPGFPMTPDELRAYCERSYDRGYCPDGSARQMMAVMTDTTRPDRLAEIEVPFLVVHGRDDPLIPLACGEDTAERAGAPLVVIDGMGHDVSIANSGPIAEALLEFVKAPALR